MLLKSTLRKTPTEVDDNDSSMDYASVDVPGQDINVFVVEDKSRQMSRPYDLKDLKSKGEHKPSALQRI